MAKNPQQVAAQAAAKAAKQREAEQKRIRLAHQREKARIRAERPRKG